MTNLERWSSEFGALLAMVLDEDLFVEGAWIVPWEVVRQYGSKSGLRVEGDWVTDPRVERVIHENCPLNR